MNRTIEKLFRSPYSVPNGVQLTSEGLWIVDQITDRVMLVDPQKVNDYYGVAYFVREIASESSNTSGLSWDGAALWLAANGDGSLWRPARSTDAAAHDGEILQVDPISGATLRRLPLPVGGGTHGLEIDPFEPDTIWLTTLKNQTLTRMRISDWSIQHVLPLPYERAHGVVRVKDGLWVVHTSNRAVVKLSLADGAILDRVDVPKSEPEPHCLSAWGDDLVYCDASSGWIARIRMN